MAAQPIKSGLDIGTLLSGGSQLLSLFGDKTTTTSGGTTTGTKTSGLDITKEGTMKLIQDILSSSNGLAAVSSGQKSAGLYNSSTNQQLTNDLIDRASASVARDTAKTVETSTTTTSGGKTVQEAPFNFSDAALGLAGAVGAKKLYDIISSDGTINNVTSAVSGMLPDFGLGSISNALDFGGFSFGGGLPTGAFGSLMSGDVGGALGQGAGFLLGNALLPGVGGPIGSVISNILPVSDVISSVGNFLTSSLGSVVCSELVRQGKLPYALYLADIAYARKHMSETTLRGYRLWGTPLVRLMQRSKFVTEAARMVVIQRAHYTAARMGYSTYSRPRAAIGAVINAVGIPVCYAIGKVLQLRNKFVGSGNKLVGA